MSSNSTILFAQKKWLSAVGAIDGIVIEKVAGLQRVCNRPLTPYTTETAFLQLQDKLHSNAYIDLRLDPNIDLSRLQNIPFPIVEAHTRMLQLREEQLYSSALQRQIKKGASFLLVKRVQEASLLFQFMKLVYARRDGHLNMREADLTKAVKASIEGGFGELLHAVDKEGKVYAALWLVWDEQCMYYVSGARNEAMQESSAMSFLLAEAIQNAKRKGLQRFDFCGSSIAGIDRFFAGFGAVKVPVLCIKQAAPWWWNALRKGLRVFKRIAG